MKFSFFPILVAAAAVGAVGALTLSNAQAQLLLQAAAGTTVYESSQNTAARQAANLFDGTPTVGAATGLGGLFDGSNNAAGGGTDNDYAPIAAFDLGALYRVTGLDHSQITGIGGTFDFVGTINIFTLSAAQYTSYIAAAPLIASQTTGKAGGLVAVPATGNYLTTQTLTLTDQTDANFTAYTLTTPVNGEYFVLRFNNASAAAGTNLGNFIGGQELRLVGTAVPEPGTFALLGLGLGAVALAARRRLAA